MNMMSLFKKSLPILLIAGLALFFFTGTHRYLSLANLAEHYDFLKTLAHEHRLIVWLCFSLIYIAAVALSLPIASLLTLSGGAIFGWPAVGLILISATAGAVIVFIAAQTVMSEFLKKKTSGFISKLEAGFQENAFSYLLALRLLPAFPFWVVNIVPALLGMRVAPFALATIIGIAPGTTIYVWVARSFDQILAQGEVPNLDALKNPVFLAPLIALGLLSMTPALIKKLKARSKQKKLDLPPKD